MAGLSLEIIMVMAMICLAVFLFIVEWVRVDVVAILMMVTLPILGLVTPKEAFVGFSSNAVISIIAVIIIGAGLDRTGLINRLVKPVLALAGSSTNRIIIFISATVAFISSFMQNIGAAALFLPAIQRISKDRSIPTSKLLMPIGFSAILGGTVTLVGSSPLILLNELLEPFGLKPFGLFDVTPVGVALVAAGILTFVVAGRFILPQPKEDAGLQEAGAMERKASNGDGHFELHIPSDFTHYRDPISVRNLRQRYLLNIVAAKEPPDHILAPPPADLELRGKMDIAVFGSEENAKRMAVELGMEMKPALDVFKSQLADDLSGSVEAVVAPRSHVEGKTLREINLRDRYQVTPIAMYSQGEVYRADLGDITLTAGDSVLLFGDWKRLQLLAEERNFLFITPIEKEPMRPQKAIFAGFWLAVALVMVIIFHLQLSMCLMTGALGMILTRVITIDEAYEAVDWRTIFLLAGLIPLGIATEKTGTAAWIANAVLSAIGDVSPIVLLTVIGILSTVFTLVISNVGATVLLVPLVVNMAIAANADPRMAALVVGLATSNSFILPTHQVNALYMGPGHYRSKDYMKAGSVVSVVFIVVMIAMIYFFYGV
ncbi:TrkA-C domain protein [Desulfatibacillum aliphaticivorans]|uniref:TrkA-C domain protein n=1 Tax=Desulfatibacillum aliphaticivorans TaxID=218208 RepID=B8F9M9_DESAL|nr:SLC13 family permease [Desulfatibacillum aliphaticivorans]ACL02975.1 TrkA-C domain protein [Desulfatibacillum aliphaticivorans]